MSASAAPTRGFRVLWACATLLAWAAFAALALHRSEAPDVLGRYSLGYAALLAALLAVCAGLAIGNAPPLVGWIQARRRELLLLPLSLLASLLGAELFLRVFDPIGISYYGEMSRYARDRVPDADLVYRHPRSTTRRYQGVEVRYNELGLRDDPIAPKTNRELRVVVLGDSVAFGWGVEQEKTFSSVLQRLLAEELERPVRVINTGVCSYNTVLERAWLGKHGFALQPDLVLLVYATNDVVPALAVWSPQDDGSGQGPLLARILMPFLKRAWLYRLLVHVHQQTPARSVPGRPGQPGWDASMDALRALADESRARDLGFAAYLWTWRLDASHAELLAAMRSALAPASVEETASWFAGEPIQRWINSPVDQHPNAQAHAIAARRMLASLRAQRLLPGAASVSGWRSNSARPRGGPAGVPPRPSSSG